MVSEPSKHNKEEGRPATTSPHAGPASHGQAGYKGQPFAAKAPCKGGGRLRLGPACKWRHPPMARLQGQPPAATQ
ncbi:hypothetical protein BHE74_00002991 [Ensete ventricosum]|nr:hypothetical protein BHE74_00002991 [Ensete ventricosum]